MNKNVKGTRVGNRENKPAVQKENANSRMPMEKCNYILMAVGFAVIVLGFILMAGGGDNDPDVFDAEKLYSFRRITLAPILVLGGYALEIYAIMKRPKADKKEE